MSHTITNFPRSRTEYYSQHTADPVQNALAPYIMRAEGQMYGVPFQFEYIPLEHAYRLLKQAMEGAAYAKTSPAEP